MIRDTSEIRGTPPSSSDEKVRTAKERHNLWLHQPQEGSVTQTHSTETSKWRKVHPGEWVPKGEDVPSSMHYNPFSPDGCNQLYRLSPDGTWLTKIEKFNQGTSSQLDTQQSVTDTIDYKSIQTIDIELLRNTARDGVNNLRNAAKDGVNDSARISSNLDLTKKLQALHKACNEFLLTRKSDLNNMQIGQIIRNDPGLQPRNSFDDIEQLVNELAVKTRSSGIQNMKRIFDNARLGAGPSSAPSPRKSSRQHHSVTQ